jgi:5-methylcytosine-specific restriction endonuclease McrA
MTHHRSFPVGPATPATNGTPLTSTQKGLGWQHQKIRAALLRAHIDGTPCAHCGRPMYLTQKLEADHSTPRSQGGTQADRLLHASCNQSRGAALSHSPKRWNLLVDPPTPTAPQPVPPSDFGVA